MGKMRRHDFVEEPIGHEKIQLDNNLTLACPAPLPPPLELPPRLQYTWYILVVGLYFFRGSGEALRLFWVARFSMRSPLVRLFVTRDLMIR